MPVLLLFFLHLVASEPSIGLLVGSEPGIGLLVGGYGNSGQLSSTETLGLSTCELPSLPSPLKRHLTILTKDDQVTARCQKPDQPQTACCCHDFLIWWPGVGLWREGCCRPIFHLLLEPSASGSGARPTLLHIFNQILTRAGSRTQTC